MTVKTKLINKYFQHLTLAGLLVLPIHSYAASFNCAKAETWVEKNVCADPQLSNLDESLASSYKNALANSSDKATLKKMQKEWLHSVRNACEDLACLTDTYTSRIAELNEMVTDESASVEISGEYERYDGNKRDENAAKITVRELKNGQVDVEGNAIWIGNAETGNINMGELNGSFSIKNNVIRYTDGEESGCRLHMTFSKSSLVINNDNMNCGGLNVTFDGKYRKVGDM